MRQRRAIRGVLPPPDKQEEGGRTLLLHLQPAPDDHHHRQQLSVLPACGVATKSHPCALVAFVAIQATQPLRPTSRAVGIAVLVVIEGWGQSHALLARSLFTHGALDFCADTV